MINNYIVFKPFEIHHFYIGILAYFLSSLIPFFWLAIPSKIVAGLVVFDDIIQHCWIQPRQYRRLKDKYKYVELILNRWRCYNAGDKITYIRLKHSYVHYLYQNIILKKWLNKSQRGFILKINKYFDELISKIKELF